VPHEVADLLGLDGNTALADVDVDTRRLLLLLVKLIADDQDGYDEYADDEVEEVTIHRRDGLFSARSAGAFGLAPGPRKEAAKRKPRNRTLFSPERVLETADGILNLALNLVGLALRFQLGVANRLADRFLDIAFDHLRRSDDPILIHDFFLQDLTPRAKNAG
jgi:hypothetical protein